MGSLCLFTFCDAGFYLKCSGKTLDRSLHRVLEQTNIRSLHYWDSSRTLHNVMLPLTEDLTLSESQATTKFPSLSQEGGIHWYYPIMLMATAMHSNIETMIRFP